MKKNKTIVEGSIVQWQNLKNQHQQLKGQVVKFYTNSALIDISIMKDYEKLELGQMTVVSKKRLKLTR